MTYNPAIHHRRSIRLKGYDYSQAGMYFVTICVHGCENLFGEIVGGENVGAGSKPAPLDGETSQPGKSSHTNRAGLESAPTNESPQPGESSRMELNEYGKIVEYTWNDLINHIDGIELGEFIIMPNHIHFIIIIIGAIRVGLEPAPTTPLSEIVRQLKTFSARRINEKRGTRGAPVWQRNYWEHIIRDEKAYDNIAAYIVNNPVTWAQDKLHGAVKP